MLHGNKPFYLNLATIFLIILTVTTISAADHPIIARIYMNIGAFFSGGIAPYWPHFILIGASLVGSAAVTWGLVRESEEFWTLPNLLIIGGVVIEALCTILLLGFDEGISNAQQSTIIELMRAAGSRRIDPEPFLSALSGKPKAQVLIEASPEAPDGLSTAAQISSLLIKAGWPKPEFKNMEEKYLQLVLQAQAPEPADFNDLRTSSRIYLISGLPDSGFGSAFNALLLAIAGGLHTVQNGVGDPRLAPPNTLVVLIFPR